MKFNTSNMRILHLIFSLQTGGSENMLIDIINEQINYADVTLFVINNQVSQALFETVDKRIKIKLYNRVPGSKNPLPIILLNITLLKNRYDVLHCHNHNMISLLMPSFHKKTVITVHDTRIESRYFSKYIQCFSISDAVRADLFNRYKVDSIVVLNGINFSGIKTKNFEKPKDDSLKVLQISRLIHQKKGQHIAISALALLVKKYNINIKIDFIGEGDSEYFLKELGEKEGISSHLNFLGIKDRKYIYESLCKYDLLIQPSINEGFGLTIVESMGAKVPVMVSNIDGPMEIIQNGNFGFYFQMGNVLDLVSKINNFVNMDNTIVQNITEKAFLNAKSKFDVAKTAQNYLLEYKKYA